MSNTIQIKRGSGTPSTSDLAQYELAYDYTNDKLYIHDPTNSSGNEIVEVGGGGASTSGSNNQILTDDGSGGINSESKLTFNGSVFEVENSSNGRGVQLNTNSEIKSLDGASSLHLQRYVDGLVRIGENSNSNLYVANKIGIGTASPSYLLHLSGTAPELAFTDTDGSKTWRTRAVTNNFHITETGAGDPFVIESGAGANAFKINSSGNVGIGVSPSGGKLHVNGHLRVIGKVLGLFNTGFVSTDSVGNQATLMRQTSGDIMLIGDTNHTEQIKIQSANSSGNGYIHCKNDGGIGFTGNTAFSSPMTVNYGAVFNEGGNNSDTRIEGNSNTHLIFADASTDRVGIGTSSPLGHLDINTESAEATKVYINGEGSQDKLLLFRHYGNSEAAGANAYAGFIGSIVDNVLSLGHYTASGTELGVMHITEVGRVGIGTQTPAKALEVIGDIRIKQGANYSNYSNIDATEARLTLETYSINTSNHPGDIIFKPAGTERMRIGDDGVVDISGSLILDTALAIAEGGTGATNAHNAKINLGLGTLADLNSIQVANFLASAITTSSESFADNDTTVMTSAAIADYVAANSGGGNADTLDNYNSTRFFRREGSASATVGPGWMTVATNTSGRKAGEILVTDADSGDHAFIRIHWLRSFHDSNFTVINCGGHGNRITGVRVLSQDNAGNNEHVYGEKILQVYVETSSSYDVKIFRMGDDAHYTEHTVHTPTIENSITGYSLHGNQLEDLNTYGFAHEQGIQAGGVIKTQSNMEAVNITASNRITAERIDITESGTVIGDIQSTDTTWLRLNQSTNKNIYTPRYIRSDGGFFVDGSSQGITGNGTFRAPNGSAGTPSVSFASDTDTGLYRRSADAISFTTGGEEQMYLADGVLQITQPVRLNFANDQRIFDNGNGGLSVGAESHELRLYSGGTDPIEFRDGGRNGTTRATLRDGVFKWGAAADYGQLTWDTGKVIVTSQSGKILELRSQNNTDMISIETNQTRFIADGTERMRVNQNGLDLSANSANKIVHTPNSSRDKYRVWNSSNYAIGMQSGFSFGGLGSHAMTFNMNNQDNRGFWWGDDGHGQGNGAMALTTDGKLTVANTMRIGYGTSDTTAPGTYGIDISANNNLRLSSAADQMIRFERSSGNTISIEHDTSQIYFYNRTTSKAMFLMSNSGSAIMGYNSNPTLELRNTAASAGSGPSLVFGHSQSGNTSVGRISTYLTDGSEANRSGVMRLWHTQAGTEYLKLQLGDNYVRQYQKGDVGDYLETIVNDDHVNFHVASGNYIQVSTDHGTLAIGPQNVSHCHYTTDRPNHWFNQMIYVNGGIVSSYNSDLSLRRNGANSDSILIQDNAVKVYTDATNERFRFGSTNRSFNTLVVGPINNNSKAFIRANNGYSNQDNPDYTFYYDDKTGMSHPAGSVIGFNTGQVERLRITNQGITFSQNGTAAAPAMSWTSDPDLGFYRNGANNMRFSAGNAIRGTWNGDGLVLNGGSLGVNVAVDTTDGVIRAGNDVIAYYSSDERLKENVKPIDNALDKVSKIRGVEFDWIVDKEIHPNEGHDVGVIAQEIEKVLPEVVETRDSGYKAVKYEKIVSLLIEAVNEQQQQINELKEKLNG